MAVSAHAVSHFDIIPSVLIVYLYFLTALHVKPPKYKDTKLIDGGVRENVPWKELKDLGADKVINIIFDDDINETCSKNLVEVAGRSLSLIGRELSNYELEGTDYNIKIKSNKVGLLDMSKIDELYELGYRQTKMKIKDIKKFQSESLKVH